MFFFWAGSSFGELLCIATLHFVKINQQQTNKETKKTKHFWMWCCLSLFLNARIFNIDLRRDFSLIFFSNGDQFYLCSYFIFKKSLHFISVLLFSISEKVSLCGCSLWPIFVLISRQLWPWLPFRPYRTFLSSSILSHSQMHLKKRGALELMVLILNKFLWQHILALLLSSSNTHTLPGTNTGKTRDRF